MWEDVPPGELPAQPHVPSHGPETVHVCGVRPHIHIHRESQPPHEYPQWITGVHLFNVWQVVPTQGHVDATREGGSHGLPPPRLPHMWAGLQAEDRGRDTHAHALAGEAVRV